MAQMDGADKRGVGSGPGNRPRPSVPDHELLRIIGEGAYGEVWLARSVTGVHRAVKVVYRNNFSDDRPYNREFEGIQKFEPISRSHEGFVDVLHVGRNGEAGYFYYVMELGDPQDPLTGDDFTRYQARTLASDSLRRGPLPFEECLEVGLSLSDALGYLHKHGLVHRDIKPANIIFVAGVPKIADLGLVTDVGSLRSYVGTTGFIAPEGPGHPPADIFSLGKVLYEISTGKDRQEFPIAPTEIMQDTRSTEFLELNEVILRACEPNVHARYQTTEAMYRDLRVLQGGKSLRRLRQLERRQSLYLRIGVIGAAAVLVLGAGGFLLNREINRRERDRERLVSAFVSHGTRRMEQDDLVAALPALTEALRLDQGDPTRAETHRVRLAAVLDQCPKLVQMWFDLDRMSAARFGADPRHVLTSGSRGWQIRDVLTGQPVSETFPSRHVLQETWLSADGQWAATYSHSQYVEVWNVANRRVVWKLAHPNWVSSARFDSAGESLLAAFFRPQVILWDLRTGREIVRFGDDPLGIIYAGFDRTGRRVITAGKDKTASIWDLTDPTQPRRLAKLIGHTDWVYEAVFSPDERLVATASFDRTARIWDAETGRELYHPCPHGAAVRSVSFSPDGQRLVTACWDFTVRFWDPATGQPALTPLPHSGRVMQASFSADGQRVLSGCYDGTVRVWDLNTLRRQPAPVRATFSPDGNRCAIVQSNVVEVRDTLRRNLIASLPATNGGTTTATFNADGSLLLLSTAAPEARQRTARLWEVATEMPAGAPFEYDATWTRRLLSADGRLFITGSSNRVRVWDARRGTLLYLLSLTNKPIEAVVMDPTGARIATASGSRAQLWDAVTGALLNGGLTNAVKLSHLEFSPDGRWLVTTCTDTTLDAHAAQLWDAATGRPVGGPMRHRDGVLWAAFAPDSKRIVTTGEDFMAFLWDVPSGSQLPALPIEHKNQIAHASWSEDGRWLVTASPNEKVLRVWDTVTGEPITPPLRQTNGVDRVRFIARGQAILAENARGEGCVWDLRRESRPVEDLVLIAQLLASRETAQNGAAFPVKPDRLRPAWERLRTLYPADFSIQGATNANAAH